MQCQFLGSHLPIVRAWHLLRCVECRSARSVDATIARGLDRLSSEPAPSLGLAQALARFGATAEVRPARRRRWFSLILQRVPLTGGLTMLAAVGTAGWLAYIDIDPKVTLPTPVAPSPNAYNVLLLAAHAIPSADRPKELGSGGTLYGHDRIAASLDGLPNKWRHEHEALPGSHAPVIDEKAPPFTIAESKALLKEYAETQSLIRRALKYRYEAPALRSMNATMPYLADYRMLARMLALEAKVKAAEGDYAGAVNSGLDAVELGESVQHGGPIVSKLVGIACEAIGRSQIWQHIDHLSAEEAHAAAQRLEHIMSQHVSLADTLEVEKCGTLATLNEMFESRDWRLKVADYAGNSANPAAGLASYVRLLPHSKRDIVDRYTRLMDQSISWARQPYYVIVSAPNSSDGQSLHDVQLTKEAEADPVNAVFFPLFSQARLQDEMGSRLQNTLLASKLALRAYYCDHHHYPRSLSALVPAYLQSVPEDPFVRSQALRYRMASIDGAPVGPIIYSIGPDLRDDGGIPAVDPSRASGFKDSTKVTDRERASARVVRPNSVGDIVAGINTK